MFVRRGSETGRGHLYRPGEVQEVLGWAQGGRKEARGTICDGRSLRCGSQASPPSCSSQISSAGIVLLGKWPREGGKSHCLFVCCSCSSTSYRMVVALVVVVNRSRSCSGTKMMRTVAKALVGSAFCLPGIIWKALFICKSFNFMTVVWSRYGRYLHFFFKLLILN